jgi:hypothetical protein
MSNANPLADRICECCNERPAIGIASTSMPISVAYCAECAAAGVDPYFILLCNTVCVGGMDLAADWWKRQVEFCLDFFGRSREVFDADVAKALKDLDDYGKGEEEAQALGGKAP